MILNFKRNRSAGTAAKKRSKCSLLVRLPLLSAILLLSAVYCQAQITTDSPIATDSSIKFSTYSTVRLNAKDSCWWEQHVDTINVDFVILVDKNDFVKKERADFIVHKYEIKQCKYTQRGVWFNPKRDEVFLLNNSQVDVLLYRIKGQFNSLLVGNSR